MNQHPVLTSPEHNEDASRGVDQIVAELQRGLDESDADIANASFAGDVLWGGAFGASVAGYETLHAIHRRLKAQAAAGASRYDVVAVSAPAPGVAVTQVRRTPLDSADQFAEMALYVLIKHDRRWWLAAGQNAPIQPGRSATERDRSD